MGLEPMTSSLPRKCSTTELQQHHHLFFVRGWGVEAQAREEARWGRLRGGRSSGGKGVERRAKEDSGPGRGAPGGAGVLPSTGPGRATGLSGAGDGNRTHAFSLEG